MFRGRGRSLVGRPRRAHPASARRARASSRTRQARGQAFAGFGTIFGRSVRCGSLELLAAAQTLVAGAFNVLIVVAALELLDVGEGGLGALELGRRHRRARRRGRRGAARRPSKRLSQALRARDAALGRPDRAHRRLSRTRVALVLLSASGIGNTLVDVAGADAAPARRARRGARARVRRRDSLIVVDARARGAARAAADRPDRHPRRRSIVDRRAPARADRAALRRGSRRSTAAPIVAGRRARPAALEPDLRAAPEPTLERSAAKLVPVDRGGRRGGLPPGRPRRPLLPRRRRAAST